MTNPGLPFEYRLALFAPTFCGVILLASNLAYTYKYSKCVTGNLLKSNGAGASAAAAVVVVFAKWMHVLETAP